MSFSNATHPIRRSALAACAALGAVLAAAPSTAAAQAADPQEFRGTVASVDRAHRAFVLHRADGRRLRVRVPARTQFSACRWGGVRVGWKLDVHARHVRGAWIAARVERARNGHYSHARWGDDGWHDGRPHDDGPGHDDPPGHDGTPDHG